MTQMVVCAHDVLPPDRLERVLTTGGEKDVGQLQDRREQAEKLTDRSRVYGGEV